MVNALLIVIITSFFSSEFKASNSYGAHKETNIFYEGIKKEAEQWSYQLKDLSIQEVEIVKEMFACGYNVIVMRLALHDLIHNIILNGLFTIQDLRSKNLNISDIGQYALQELNSSTVQLDDTLKLYNNSMLRYNELEFYLQHPKRSYVRAVVDNMVFNLKQIIINAVACDRKYETVDRTFEQSSQLIDAINTKLITLKGLLTDNTTLEDNFNNFKLYEELIPHLQQTSLNQIEKLFSLYQLVESLNRNIQTLTAQVFYIYYEVIKTSF